MDSDSMKTTIDFPQYAHLKEICIVDPLLEEPNTNVLYVHLYSNTRAEITLESVQILRYEREYDTLVIADLSDINKSPVIRKIAMKDYNINWFLVRSC